MKYLTLILPLLFACTQERSSVPLSNYLDGEYYVYRTEVDGVNEYYFNSSVLLDFNASFGQPSGNIWDFNASGVVDSQDLALGLSGYGNGFDADYDIESAQVLGQFSSGWIIDLEGWDVAFLKVTPSDEGGQFIPETLNSFFLEGERSGQTWKVWYYAAN